MRIPPFEGSKGLRGRTVDSSLSPSDLRGTRAEHIDMERHHSSRAWPCLLTAEKTHSTICAKALGGGGSGDHSTHRVHVVDNPHARRRSDGRARNRQLLREHRTQGKGLSTIQQIAYMARSPHSTSSKATDAGQTPRTPNQTRRRMLGSRLATLTQAM